tara:strand:+ start:18 stop:131 length:114 start_codon:yes stop_codon:yes gene_type:complete
LLLVPGSDAMNNEHGYGVGGVFGASGSVKAGAGAVDC